MGVREGELATEWLARSLGAIEAVCAAAQWFAVERGDWDGVAEAAEHRRAQRVYAVNRAVRAIVNGDAPPEVPEQPPDQNDEPPY